MGLSEEKAKDAAETIIRREKLKREGSFLVGLCFVYVGTLPCP